jgi:hypothetical protein
MKARAKCRIAASPLLLAATLASADPPLGVLPPDQVALPGVSLEAMPGGLRPGSDPFSLLMRPEVQRDLALSEEQKASLRRANPLFREGVVHRDAPGNAAQFERLLWTSRGAIANILSAQQLERLRQILLQQGGICVIPEDPQLLDRLRIGAQLKSEIAAACRALAAALKTAFQSPPPGENPCPTLRSNQVRMEQMLQQGEAEIDAMLSAEQRRTLDELMGAGLAIGRRAIAECAADPAPMHEATMREAQ